MAARRRKKFTNEERNTFKAYVDKRRSDGITIGEACEEFTKEYAKKNPKSDKEFTATLYNYYRLSDNKKATTPKPRPIISVSSEDTPPAKPSAPPSRTLPTVFYSQLHDGKVIAIIGEPGPVSKLIREIEANIDS